MQPADSHASTGRSAREGEAGWKSRLRRTRGGALLLKAVVLVVGFSFIAVGGVLVALPGPLTIPPVLLGLWILASEFAWADRLFQRAKSSASEAWDKAKQRPLASGLMTLLGLTALGAGIWALSHYDVLDRARDAVGL